MVRYEDPWLSRGSGGDPFYGSGGDPWLSHGSLWGPMAVLWFWWGSILVLVGIHPMVLSGDLWLSRGSGGDPFFGSGGDPSRGSGGGSLVILWFWVGIHSLVLGGIHSLVLVEIHPLVLSGDPWLSHGSL